jgi:dethiobiotin synthetase
MFRTRLMGAIIFITGTDTGVGKTLLTALLLTHLRHQGRHALAMKPFCSGGLTDVHLLRGAQQNEISVSQINPYYFEQPVAPLVAGRHAGTTVVLPEVVDRIESLAGQCEVLLVEGVGGLFVPLGDHYTVADLIASICCPVLLVARNKSGTINHTLLSLAALRGRTIPRSRVVLMDPRRGDISGRSNARMIREFAPEPVFCVPFLGPNPMARRQLETNAKKLKKTLAHILRVGILPMLSEQGSAYQGKSGARISLASDAQNGNLTEAF